jgi:nicotinate-nucleotide adenylyltransferase
MKKVGLFFGSFNPIHIGHMIIASHVADNTDLKEIWFVVSPHNPLKEKNTLLADHHRLEMVSRAIDDDPRFRVSDIEFQLERPSYTIVTLAYLKEKYPNTEFTLLMGADNLVSLPKWKNYQSILDNHRIVVYNRVSQNAVAKLNGDIIELDAPLLNISSSLVRKNISEGKSVRYLLPSGTWRYLDEMNFYK